MRLRRGISSARWAIGSDGLNWSAKESLWTAEAEIQEKMSIKLRDVQTKIIKEKDGSYAIACSALGVYSVGETLAEARRNFGQALELHLSALREKAIEAVA